MLRQDYLKSFEQRDLERSIKPIRVDGTSTVNVTYLGYTLSNTPNETSRYWKIERVEQVGDNVTITTAGNGEFAHAWSQRTSLSYD